MVAESDGKKIVEPFWWKREEGFIMDHDVCGKIPDPSHSHPTQQWTLFLVNILFISH